MAGFESWTPHRDPQLQSEALERFASETLGKAHIGPSQLLESISLTTGATVPVQHLLNRAVRGWHVVDKDAAATIYRDATFTGDLTLFLPLVTDVNVTVSLVVF